MCTDLDLRCFAFSPVGRNSIVNTKLNIIHWIALVDQLGTQLPRLLEFRHPVLSKCLSFCIFLLSLRMCFKSKYAIFCSCKPIFFLYSSLEHRHRERPIPFREWILGFLLEKALFSQYQHHLRKIPPFEKSLLISSAYFLPRSTLF